MNLNDRNKQRKCLEENFFVITSDNCGSIQPRLYGYVITDNTIYLGEQPSNQILDRYTAGCFTNIVVTDSIIIQQDYYGLQGIYLYREKDFFAVSNSFYHLFTYLSDKRKLTVNEDFLGLFFTSGSTPYSITFTAVNEIIQILPDCFVFINIHHKNLEVVRNTFSHKKFALDTKEAIDIIDMLHSKYSNIFTSLAQQDYQITLDVTGGMDSRSTLAMISDKGFPKNVRYNSLIGDFHTCKEDYEIAQKIAKIYKFELNRSLKSNIIEFHSVISLIFALSTQFFYNSRFYLSYSFYPTPAFSFSGFGGEMLRDYIPTDEEKFVWEECHWPTFNSIDFVSPGQRLLRSEISFLKDNYYKEAFKNQMMYRLCRLRYHFGKSAFYYYLFNNINISPLLDPSLDLIDLYSGGKDRNLLIGIILHRYAKELDNINFDNNRSISRETMERSIFINSCYPYDTFDNKPSNEQIKVINNHSFFPLHWHEDNFSYDKYIQRLMDSNVLMGSFTNEQTQEIFAFCNKFATNHPDRKLDFYTRLYYIYLLKSNLEINNFNNSIFYAER